MPSELELIVWDVKHGSAIFINTPNNKKYVVDLGTGSYGNSDTVFSPLLYLKNQYGISHIDGLVITHPHGDHLDDISNLKHFTVSTLRCPRTLSENDIRQANQTKDKQNIDAYLALTNQFSGSIQAGTSVFDSLNNGGVSFVRFSPISPATSNINNHSVVNVLEYASSKIIIPGDNEPPAWKELLESSSFCSSAKNADILVAPHHGRESGFFKELLDLIKPKLTIISDGRFCDTSATNRYSNSSSGWTVHHRDNRSSEARKCVTTRNDGSILIKLGHNQGKPFLSVTID